MSIAGETKKKMEAAIEHLREELKGIRTGQANPGLVENITVEVYGSQMRIRDVASITSPETRQLMITPFDANNVGSIGKAIEKANIGFMPIVEGNLVRINIPPMDENLRKEMVKLCHQKQEEAKVSIRNVRRESNETVRKQKADGEIGEDIMHSQEEEIQKLTNDFCNQVDSITATKEKEVSSI